MPRDPYDENDKPEPRKGGAGGISVTQNVGPLPVWGWGAVAIAAVFLWRRIAGTPKAQAAGAVNGPAQPPAYTPATGGVYLLPGANGTGTSPAPAPTYLPQYPLAGQGQAPAGGQCPVGTVLLQGANGYTCATAQQATGLGGFLQAVKAGY